MEAITAPLEFEWANQLLPSPLVPAELALAVALSLLRQQPATVGAVSAGDELIVATLEAEGVSCSRILLRGAASAGVPDVCYQTDEAGAERFDELLALTLQQPGRLHSESATWLRERMLAVAQLRANADPATFFTLPETDSKWLHLEVSSGGEKGSPEPRFWRTWLLGLLVLAAFFGLLDAYLFMAGPSFAFWLLPILPLAGSLCFGALLVARLRAWRRQVALSWLARPARLRPDSEQVARQLTSTPWHLLWLPPLLLACSFLVVMLSMGAGSRPTLGVLLGPVLVALVAQAAVAAYQGWRTVRKTRALIDGLPPGLIPAPSAIGPLWQLYRAY